MAIKLVAIDMDGTLFDDNKNVSDDVAMAISAAQKRGVKIVPCTGRPLHGVLPTLEKLNLMGDDNYSITYNGALIQHNSDNEVIFRRTLTRDDFIQIEKLSREIGVHCHFLDLERVYTTNKDVSPYTIRECFMNDLPLRYLTVDEIAPDVDILKTMMIDKAEILSEAIKKIPAQFFERYTILRSEKFFLEWLNKDASKGKAVAHLAQYLNIPQNEVMAIGDNENDSDMITYAGIGVAMGNAVEPIKQISDFITKTNNQHGVAHAIETFILK